MTRAVPEKHIINFFWPKATVHSCIFSFITSWLRSGVRVQVRML